MHERSDSLYAKWLDAAVKYDYFSCGVAGAFFAYLGEHYSPHRLGMNFQTVELVSIVLFGASFFCGAKRIESSNRFARAQYRSMLASERASYCMGHLDNPSDPPPYRKPETGDICSEKDLRELQTDYLTEMKECNQLVDKISPWTSRWYTGRNILLFLGILMTMIAKLLQAYST